MSENSNKSEKKFPTAVAITLIICATILVLTVTSMIFGGIMANKFINEFPDKLPENITINFR